MALRNDQWTKSTGSETCIAFRNRYNRLKQTDFMLQNIKNSFDSRLLSWCRKHFNEANPGLILSSYKRWIKLSFQNN